MTAIRSAMSTTLRGLISLQVAWSRAFDRLLPGDLKTDLMAYFKQRYLVQLIMPNSRVYEAGGGRYPVITREQKQERNLYIVGLDLNVEELKAAPLGIYDETTVADLMNFQGRGDGDIIVSQMVLEHLEDNGKAFFTFQTILKPGGLALILVPCRNAAFARLNLLLPESLKRWIMLLVDPNSLKAGSGWPAHYDRCTPNGFRRLAEASGFEVVDLKTCYYSGYFEFCFPLYAAWRLWVLLARALMKEQAAETFCICLRKSAKLTKAATTA